MRRADYEQAVEAARRWIAEHGRYPQRLSEEPVQHIVNRYDYVGD
jgi:hypothetical protein